jgi:hypothetical protein
MGLPEFDFRQRSIVCHPKTTGDCYSAHKKSRGNEWRRHKALIKHWPKIGQDGRSSLSQAAGSAAR